MSNAMPQTWRGILSTFLFLMLINVVLSFFAYRTAVGPDQWVKADQESWAKHLQVRNPTLNVPPVIPADR